MRRPRPPSPAPGPPRPRSCACCGLRWPRSALPLRPCDRRSVRVARWGSGRAGAACHLGAPLGSARVSEERLRPPGGGSSGPGSGGDGGVNGLRPTAVRSSGTGKLAHPGARGREECSGCLGSAPLPFRGRVSTPWMEVSAARVAATSLSHRAAYSFHRKCIRGSWRSGVTCNEQSVPCKVWESGFLPTAGGWGWQALLTLLSYCFSYVESEVTLNH